MQNLYQNVVLKCCTRFIMGSVPPGEDIIVLLLKLIERCTELLFLKIKNSSSKGQMYFISEGPSEVLCQLL